MFISPAFAQATGSSGSGVSDLFSFMIPMVAIFGIMYFLVIRPQQQRMAQLKEMIKNVRRGDVIVTTGGIIAKVIRVVDDNELQVEIADNVRVRLMRQMISEVRSRSDAPKEAS
jgi:preprotein translocase subunit YajC